MSKSKVFLLYPFCKLVKGYARCAIYDLEAKKLHLISNSVYDFIDSSRGKSQEDIYDLYDTSGKEVVNSLISSLLNKNLVRFVKKKDYTRFLPMQIPPERESLIENMVIDIDAESVYNLYDAFRKIVVFGLRVIQLRFLYNINFDQLVQIIAEAYAIGAEAIELLIPFKTIEDIENPYVLFDKYQNITNLYVWNATTDKAEDYKQCRILFMKKSVNYSDSCGFVSEKSFLCNKRFYVDAQNRNTCLWKKCAIDKNGIIKNCPYMQQGFGNINDTTVEQLKHIVKSKEFTHLFVIQKDDIQTCNVCEFRYACFDCRVFLSERNNIFSKPIKCNYDPYKAKWVNE
jgi:SPASM domain peptide maturase of grasp-with-spasm system